MAIRKRTDTAGSVSCQLDYFNPSGKRVRKSFKLKKHVVAERDNIGVSVQQGTYEDTSKYRKKTFGELCREYEKNFKHKPSWLW